jgi:hypothetical protein
MERVKGIEPSSSAWKAIALPLSYTRFAPSCCTTKFVLARSCWRILRQVGWWRELDSNQRRHSQRVYSPSPLAARASLRNQRIAPIIATSANISAQSERVYIFGQSDPSMADFEL